MTPARRLFVLIGVVAAVLLPTTSAQAWYSVIQPGFQRIEALL